MDRERSCWKLSALDPDALLILLEAATWAERSGDGETAVEGGAEWLWVTLTDACGAAPLYLLVVDGLGGVPS